MATYTVRSGDTMSAIARREGVSLAALERANPAVKNPNRIYTGERLTVPGSHDVFHPASAHGHSSSFKGFPRVNQLREPTSDGHRDENARMNCVSASIAAGLEYLTGRRYNGDELKDAVYGQRYHGGQSAASYVRYCKRQGVKLTRVNEPTQTALVNKLKDYLRRGIPVVLTMPSQWGIAPRNPRHPRGSTHVGIACGLNPDGSIRVMNPWGGFFQTQSTGWWQARLCDGSIWPMSR